jgi:hypothetical protein
MKNYYLLITAIFFSYVLVASAQEPKDTTKSASEKETVRILTDGDLDLELELDNFKFSLNSSPDWISKEERPIVKFYYGNSKLEDKNYTDVPFKDNIQLELVMGYYKFKEHKKSIITKTSANEFFIANISDKIIDPKDKFKGVNTDAWRFGFNDKSGYGYQFHKNFRIDLAHTDGIGWTHIKFSPKNWVEQTDTFRFGAFNESFRFGEQFESSVSLTLFEKLSINAGYERINVYPRHMFWYWSLGKIIEAGSHGLVDEFVKEIRKFSPEFTPIFHFLLKSGLSYGIYELRKKKMNWPVKTAPPFTFENIKVGASFNF